MSARLHVDKPTRRHRCPKGASWFVPSHNPVVRALRTYLLLFVIFMIPVGGIIWVAIGIARGWSTSGLVAGLVGGLICGALVTASLAALDVIGDRGRCPGEPHGPRQDVSVSVQAGNDLPDRIQAALRALNAEIVAADVASGRYRARTRWSWRSFGEFVTVQLTGDPSAPVANVASRPVVRTTLIDYGRGRRNVHEIV